MFPVKSKGRGNHKPRYWYCRWVVWRPPGTEQPNYGMVDRPSAQTHNLNSEREPLARSKNVTIISFYPHDSDMVRFSESPRPMVCKWLARLATERVVTKLPPISPRLRFVSPAPEPSCIPTRPTSKLGRPTVDRPSPP